MLDGGVMRLQATVLGDQLMCSVARDTLSHKALVPHDPERVAGLSHRIIEVLARGNRQRKLAEACLADLRALGEELYRLLVPQTVREELEAHRKEPLLVEIDEGLVVVPWELLYDGKEFLCRRFDVGRHVSTPQPRLAPSAARMSVPARMLVLCSDPRGDLGSVADEGDAIVDTLQEHPGVKVRSVVDKDLDFVRKVLKDYDMVHFAGHADYNPADPEASGWHLGDGKLTARDVTALAGGRPMPLLVFSNACQSSREGAWQAEDPARVFGLANAFLLSGVRYYIGTQWEIVDVHSQQFARAFYSELARGRSIGGSMRRARESLVVSEGEGALAWAGYVLYGHPAYAPLRMGDEVSGPLFKMPTPADIVSRASLKAVAKHSPARGGPIVSSRPRTRGRAPTQAPSPAGLSTGKAILLIVAAALVTGLLVTLLTRWL